MFFSKIQPPCGFPVFGGNSLYFPPCPSTKDTTFPIPISRGFSITFPKRFPFFSPGFSRSIVENFLFFVYNNKVYPCPFFVVSRPFFRNSPSGRKIHRTLFPLSFRFMDRVDRPFSLHHFQWNQYEREEPHHGICWIICRSLGADLQLLPRAHHRSRL